MEFYYFIFQALKVVEFRFGSWKIMKSHENQQVICKCQAMQIQSKI